MTENGKPKLAMYWASSCGGCEISVLNIHEHILTVDAVFDLAFFPCVADFKVSDVEGYPDGYIDICLFNGAIRNSENEEMAHLLREKSKILVAYGSCSGEGCIPALSNLTSFLVYSAVLDNATCQPCGDADGETGQLIDLPPVPNPECPGGASCRCIHIAVRDIS